MPGGRNTHGYKTLKKNFSKLSKAMEKDLKSVCDVLVDESLITSGQRDKVMNPRNDVGERASNLASVLLNKVDQEENNFHKLIGVLQSLPETFEDFLKNMGVDNASQSTTGAAMSSTTSTTLGSTSSGDSHYPCTIANLEKELKGISDPYRLGLQLGIEDSYLDGMEKNHSGDVARQRTAMIKHWYNNTAESERTWGRVADAVNALGDHRNLESRLRELDNMSTTSGLGSGSSSGTGAKLQGGAGLDKPQDTPNRTSDDREPPPEPKRQKRQGGALKFSNDLSPADLVDWLSQELTARSLTLEKDVKSELKEQQINGEAFKDLTKDDLNEMGFKMGPRKIILKIIEDLKQADVEA